ncbi:MAG: thiol peroxidase [Desulfobacterales bacterium]|nr:thiol peroxidase [Desulfobacterales bacterium]MCP4160120.1 thiol peroxidase [Deltaproteobacteria bacterium]
MKENTGLVTMGGNPVTLLGNIVEEGDKAPAFLLQKTDMSDAKLSDYSGKVIIISVVPSLDTPVCDLQTKRFNSEASELGDNVVILTVSMDLPFAQSRWCGASDISSVVTLSDHRTAEFGTSYGVLMKGARLLARSIFLIDKEGKIAYKELIKEIRDEPDYGSVLSKVRDLL